MKPLDIFGKRGLIAIGLAIFLIILAVILASPKVQGDTALDERVAQLEADVDVLYDAVWWAQRPSSTLPPGTTVTQPVTTTTLPSTTTTTRPPSTTTTRPPTTSTTTTGFNLAAAVASCPSGGTVSIPPGTYLLSSQISPKSNITIAGAGSDQTIIRVNAQYGFVLDGLSNITLEGFSITGAWHSAISVGYGKSASGITLRGLEISDCGVCGFWTGSTSRVDNVVIEDCLVHDCGEFGVTHGEGGSAANWTVRRSVFYSFGSGGQYPPHGFYGRKFTNLLVEDCTFSGPLGAVPNGWSGFEVDDSTAVVRRCTATDCKTGNDTRGGFGFIVLGSGNVRFEDCSGSGNLADFYECAFTGTVTYTRCVGTVKRWP